MSVKTARKSANQAADYAASLCAGENENAAMQKQRLLMLYRRLRPDQQQAVRDFTDRLIGFDLIKTE